MFKKKIIMLCKKLSRKLKTAFYLLIFNRKGLYERLYRYKSTIFPQANDPWRFEAEIGRIQNTIQFHGTVTDELLADIEKLEKKITLCTAKKINFHRKCTLIHAINSIKNTSAK
jgi:hypothetical protein